jgi:hypothetical protein
MDMCTHESETKHLLCLLWFMTLIERDVDSLMQVCRQMVLSVVHGRPRRFSNTACRYAPSSRRPRGGRIGTRARHTRLTVVTAALEVLVTFHEVKDQYVVYYNMVADTCALPLGAGTSEAWIVTSWSCKPETS